MDNASLKELGMDDEIVEITAPEFVGNSNNGSSQGLENQMDTTKKSLDNQIEVLDIIDLTEEWYIIFSLNLDSLWKLVYTLCLTKSC